MRFKALGLRIIDSKCEFEFPVFSSQFDAEVVADILNNLVGDSE